jgi:predicted nucleotidyltransferase
MDLTEQQRRNIQEWAEGTRVVETVRLYGSRAKGSARPDSDVDLAITVSAGNYVRFANEWQKELSDGLGLGVRLKQYNSPADDTVRRYCDEFSVVLFPR